MKKRFLAILCTALLLLPVLSGCGKDVQGDVPSSDGGEESPAPAVLTIDYAPAELPEAYEEIILDEDPTYRADVFLTTDALVSNLRLTEITYDATAETEVVDFSETEILGELETFTPERPLVVRMVFYGDVPTRGLAYTDTDGTEKHCAISMSGLDGSLLLWEISVVENT